MPKRLIAATLRASALRANERDVVALFERAELTHFGQNRIKQNLRWLLAMLPQRVYQAQFPEFLPGIVERLRDAVCVEHQGVAGVELALGHRAVPVREDSYNRAGGIEPLQRVVAAEE